MRKPSSRYLPVILILAVLALGVGYYSGLLSMNAGHQDSATKSVGKVEPSKDLPNSDDVIAIVREKKYPTPEQRIPVKKAVPAQENKKKEQPLPAHYIRNLECYGPTIEIRLKNEIAPGATISIPSGKLVYFGESIRSQTQKETEAWVDACHEEPFDVGYVYIYGSPEQFSEKPTIRRIKLTPGSLKFPEVSVLSGIFPIGVPKDLKGFVETEAGLYHNKPDNKYGAGYYIAPSSYLTPRGSRFGFSCAPKVYGGSECNTWYKLDIQKGVTIKYWFYTDHPPNKNMPKILVEWREKQDSYGVPQDQWLDLDRRIRRALEGMIVKPANN